MPPHIATATLASTTGVLLAVDIPFPVELSSLALVAVVLRYFLHRDALSHTHHDERLTAIEEQLNYERDMTSEQRRLKHALQNEVSATRAVISVVVPQAAKCSCGVMEPLIPVLQQLSLDIKEPTE